VCVCDLFSLRKRKTPVSLCGTKVMAPEFPELSRHTASAIKINECRSRAAPLGQCGQVLPTVGLQTCDRLRGWGQDPSEVVGRRTATTALSAGSSMQFVGRDSSVDMATRYRLDCPGIESWWVQGILYPSTLSLRPHPRRIQWGPGLFPPGE
jgi:hypothetical protein